MPPAVVANSTESGWRFSADPRANWETSVCRNPLAMMTMISIGTPMDGPPAPQATSTARAPLMMAPKYGM